LARSTLEGAHLGAELIGSNASGALTMPNSGGMACR
jgi:hypothetical protein